MSIPEHLKIIETLKSMIRSQELQAGSILPSESYLCQHFHLDPKSLHQGLLTLVDEGYIYNIPGKGYFVHEPRIDVYELVFNEMNLNGLNDTDSQIIGVDIIRSTPDIQTHLKTPDEQRVIKIQRLLRQEGSPIALDVKYIPYHRGLPIIEQEIRYATFPKMVAIHGSLSAIKRKLSIRAIPASTSILKHLNLPMGMPILSVEQTLMDESDKVIGWGTVYMAGHEAHLDAVSSFK